jgi:surface protein
MLKYYLDKTGKVIKSILFPSSEFVDTEPREGSMNPVTSGAVAGSVAQQSSNIAPSYTKKTYEANSYVMQGGVLYTNPNAIGTAEDWNPAHWTQTTVAEQTEQDMKDMEEMFLVNLPCAAKTFRFEFSKMDYDPTVAGVGSSGTWKKLNAKFHNVWDWTKSASQPTSFQSAFSNAFKDADNLVSVIYAGDISAITLFGDCFQGCSSLVKVCLFDTSAATNIVGMFSGCSSLEEIPLFDFGSLTNMFGAFNNCSSLRSIPLFDTSKVTNMSNVFNGCVNVEEGALALYEQASTQTTPPTTHVDTFKNCGKNTTTGAAELAQIPTSWGGTAAG